MLINLITSGVEAMRGHGKLTIKTKNLHLDKDLKGYKSINTGDYAVLEISDKGQGIEPDTLDKIFDPFFSTKSMDGVRGTGLGLSVVHSVMQDHQGYIQVKSAPGAGTTFSV